MRNLLVAAAAVSLVATPLAAAKRDPDAQLAQLLDGRVAGKSVNCIRLSTSWESRTIPHRTIAYRDGSTWYVARFDNGCNILDDFSFVVTKTPTDLLCGGDIAEIHDQSSHIFRGTCAFDGFTPYTRPRLQRP
jgi:hypothetical protein